MQPVDENLQIRRVRSALGRLELCNVAAPGKAHSEDLVDTTDSAAWLLDGASAHYDAAACTDHDAPWFVRQLSHGLATELSQPGPRALTDLLCAAIDRVGTLHTQLCPHVPPGHGPSATVVIVRRRDQALEYLVLGDSALLVQTADDEINHHRDTRLSAIAADLRDTISRTLRAGRGYDDPDHRDQIRALHTAEREARNRDGGYWIAADDPDAALHSLTGHYSLTDPVTAARRVALISDGITRALTHLQIYSDWRHLLEDLFDPGILATITRIRRAERADPHASRHPRTKPSDDTAAITCTLAP
jgi:hypothetical protein